MECNYDRLSPSIPIPEAIGSMALRRWCFTPIQIQFNQNIQLEIGMTFVGVTIASLFALRPASHAISVSIAPQLFESHSAEAHEISKNV